LLKEIAKRRVVITGAGLVTPLGRNCGETFDKAAQGCSGIDYITAFDTAGLPCRIGGQVDDSWLEGHEGAWQRFPSRGLRLLRTAAREAVGSAGLAEIQRRERIGCAIGFHGDNPSVPDLLLLHRHFDGNALDMHRIAAEGTYPATNFLARKPDVAVSLMATSLDCGGPALSVTSACAAGSQAIGEAFRMIRNGSADVMVAGGGDSQLNFVGFIGFVLIKALSSKYREPQKASRPFDRKRNGFVMSEGAGIVVLEDHDHARARGARIMGEVLGYGASADAYRITDTHPKGLGACIAIRAALDDADLAPDDIQYINAHGTSTTQNDLTETLAVKEVFGTSAKQIPLSSNKSMIGHTIGGAGAIEAILTLVGMERSIMLPTINQEFRDPKCDLDYVPNEARLQAHERALSNSFGFGGQNACLCLGRYHG